MDPIHPIVPRRPDIAAIEPADQHALERESREEREKRRRRRRREPPPPPREDGEGHIDIRA